MTTEEAIKILTQLKEIHEGTDWKEYKDANMEAFELAIQALRENAELKAQLKNYQKALFALQDEIFEVMKDEDGDRH